MYVYIRKSKECNHYTSDSLRRSNHVLPRVTISFKILNLDSNLLVLKFLNLDCFRLLVIITISQL